MIKWQLLEGHRDDSTGDSYAWEYNEKHDMQKLSKYVESQYGWNVIKHGSAQGRTWCTCSVYSHSHSLPITPLTTKLS